jgi:hypothetical protein
MFNNIIVVVDNTQRLTMFMHVHQYARWHVLVSMSTNGNNVYPHLCLAWAANGWNEE